MIDSENYFRNSNIFIWEIVLEILISVEEWYKLLSNIIFLLINNSFSSSMVTAVVMLCVAQVSGPEVEKTAADG